jgi:hypothetical protein
MSEKTSGTSPSEKGEKSEKGKVTIETVLKNSKAFSFKESTPMPEVELVGRIRRLEDKEKFVLFPAYGTQWSNYTLELNASDVKKLEPVFKDNVGEENYKICLPYEAFVKVIFQASNFYYPGYQQAAEEEKPEKQQQQPFQQFQYQPQQYQYGYFGSPYGMRC